MVTCAECITCSRAEFQCKIGSAMFLFFIFMCSMYFVLLNVFVQLVKQELQYHHK